MKLRTFFYFKLHMTVGTYRLSHWR